MAHIDIIYLNIVTNDTQIAELHRRTGTEALLIAVRSSQDDFLQPRTFVTSDRVSSFFESVFHRTAIDFGVKLEAYLISGIQGMSILDILLYPLN